MPHVVNGGGSGGSGGTGTIDAATITALAAVASASLDTSAQVWVESVGDYFGLRVSTQTPDAITIVNASGKPGYQWIRLSITNEVFGAQTIWVIDPQNSTGVASDENSGVNNTRPLRTYSELARRLSHVYIRATINITILGDQDPADEPMFTFSVADDLAFVGGVIFTFPLTNALYTGTISTYTKSAAAPNHDLGDRITDTGIPVSYTASGLAANGVLFKRTSSTETYWWGAADLASKTLRTSPL